MFLGKNNFVWYINRILWCIGNYVQRTFVLPIAMSWHTKEYRQVLPLGRVVCFISKLLTSWILKSCYFWHIITFKQPYKKFKSLHSKNQSPSKKTYKQLSTCSQNIFYRYRLELKNVLIRNNMTFWNMYIIIIVSFLVILFLGLIFLLSQCVTSRYISKPCPTKSYSVDSSIKAANITKEEIAKNLQFRLNLFRNATQKLIEKYVSTFCWCFFYLAKLYAYGGFVFVFLLNINGRHS